MLNLGTHETMHNTVHLEIIPSIAQHCSECYQFHSQMFEYEEQSMDHQNFNLSKFWINASISALRSFNSSLLDLLVKYIDHSLKYTPARE